MNCLIQPWHNVLSKPICTTPTSLGLNRNMDCLILSGPHVVHDLLSGESGELGLLSFFLKTLIKNTNNPLPYLSHLHDSPSHVFVVALSLSHRMFAVCQFIQCSSPLPSPPLLLASSSFLLSPLTHLVNRSSSFSPPSFSLYHHKYCYKLDPYQFILDTYQSDYGLA